MEHKQEDICVESRGYLRDDSLPTYALPFIALDTMNAIPAIADNPMAISL